MLPDFRVRQRDYLLEIAQSITVELDLDKVLARILKISIEMLAGQAGLIALLEIKEGWRIAASQGIPPSFLNQLEPLLGEIPKQEQTDRFELQQINQLLQRLTRAASLGLLTGVVLPMIARREVIGVIFIFRNYSGTFSTNDKALLKSFADQAAIAVHNAQLYTQISQEKQRINALLDTAADGILILAADHTIERYNPALARILGVYENNLIGLRHENVIRWSNIREGISLESAEQGGWPLTQHATLYIEGDLIREEGLPLPVGITYAPLFSQGGYLLNIIATVRDISHFREAEELKSTFISVISHELKTPVALIKGYVSTLRREDVSWDRKIIADSLEVIEEESDHLTEMIDNLLDATRLQAGALEISLSDMSMESLVNRIVQRFQTQVNMHTIEVDFPSDFPVVLGDEVRLGQVLSNLISNAIKYSPKGGLIKISGQVKAGQVVICVSDQGPGIDPGDIPFVFDRFYRSDRASKTTKGAGLGLFLSRAVIEAHGGRMWVDPRPGDGARICFSLPRDPA